MDLSCCGNVSCRVERSFQLLTRRLAELEHQLNRRGGTRADAPLDLSIDKWSQRRPGINPVPDTSGPIRTRRTRMLVASSSPSSLSSASSSSSSPQPPPPSSSSSRHSPMAAPKSQVAPSSGDRSYHLRTSPLLLSLLDHRSSMVVPITVATARNSDAAAVITSTTAVSVASAGRQCGAAAAVAATTAAISIGHRQKAARTTMCSQRRPTQVHIEKISITYAVCMLAFAYRRADACAVARAACSTTITTTTTTTTATTTTTLFSVYVLQDTVQQIHAATVRLVAQFPFLRPYLLYRCFGPPASVRQLCSHMNELLVVRTDATLTSICCCDNVISIVLGATPQALASASAIDRDPLAQVSPLHDFLATAFESYCDQSEILFRRSD